MGGSAIGRQERLLKGVELSPNQVKFECLSGPKLPIPLGESVDLHMAFQLDSARLRLTGFKVLCCVVVI